MVIKEDALCNRGPEDNVLYTRKFNSYFWCKSHEDLIRIIKSSNVSYISEYIFDKDPVNFFYDIDIKEKVNPEEFKEYKSVIQEIINVTSELFKKWKFKVVVLKSHTTEKNVSKAGHKKSFHIIFVGIHCSVRTCASIVNHLFSNSDLKGIVDTSIYREGNFRAYLCSKDKEIRPLVRCKSLGDQDYSDVETFVQYNCSENVLTETDFGIPIKGKKSGDTTSGHRKKIKLDRSIESSEMAVKLNVSEDEVKSVLNKLDRKYFSERNYWLQIGYILENIGSSLETWLEFSSKWADYVEHEATKSWESIERANRSKNPGKNH